MSTDDYVEGFVCTLDTCSVEDWGYVRYQPSIAGNGVFLGLMVLLAAIQVFLGVRHKSSGFTWCIVLGLVTEAMGYVSRVLLHGNPFNRDYFLWYLITLTIGPVFIAAAIYLTIGRIVVVYGEGSSRIKPRSYTAIFLGCDICSLVVQAAGGGIAASFPITNQYMIDIGTNILVAGLSIQVAGLFFFIACSLEFLFRASKRPELRNPEFTDLARSRRFKLFLCFLFASAMFLFTRTVFRAVELSEGFSGDLANDEIAFMVLDGAMVVLSVSCLTVMHPGIGFAGRWNETIFYFRTTERRKLAEAARAAQEAQDAQEPTFIGSDKEGPETASTRV